jgi:hypothetical protein
MKNLARLMTGILLMLMSAIVAGGLSLISPGTLARRCVRVPVRPSRPAGHFPSTAEGE